MQRCDTLVMYLNMDSACARLKMNGSHSTSEEEKKRSYITLHALRMYKKVDITCEQTRRDDKRKTKGRRKGECKLGGEKRTEHTRRVQYRTPARRKKSEVGCTLRYRNNPPTLCIFSYSCHVRGESPVQKLTADEWRREASASRLNSLQNLQSRYIALISASVA
mmetsp:Transcript_47048/g.121555  ORF Transcript_47048/g.121555 Transcript_47048/m.121555 type:complete len:164 (-) Transcript_47048:1352-1843(-)